MAYFTFNTNIPLPRTAEELQERIKSLFAIRTELDREIESLMGCKAEAAKPYHCVRCDYKWKSRLAHRPKMCPRCRIKKFDRPPLYTYEEKIQRKKELLLAKAKSAIQMEQARFEIPVSVAPMPHSVLTRQVSTEADSIQNVSLTPPPAPDRPLSLRERLEQLKRESVAGANAYASNATADGESPLLLQRAVIRPATLGDETAHSMEETYLGTADTPPASNGHDAVPSEDELMEAINGDDAT